jgi:hypothetical protein
VANPILPLFSNSISLPYGTKPFPAIANRTKADISEPFLTRGLYVFLFNLT